ncbi:MAG: tRNA (N(6)-L-threonylcarbamoyladenosine(37)-C(2))-methylthiotransferase MtaB [candidate division Zixibacteria bacterium]|nr:tRNA (N(6)-L-threonylcarbamoyladenosine(37)-C(2))-methylthiotransferase MtaB [candidate division Zixibacteria bacterium]
MKAALFTIGCKVNQYETEAIAEKLEVLGFQRVDFGEKADIYVINTCTVTGESDRSSRQAIYRARRRSPDARIVVTGCYAQLDKEFLESLPGVSLVVKQEDKGKLPRLIAEMMAQEAKVTETDDPFFGFSVKGLAKHTRALVKIQDGCEKNCAYCVVPLARGRERSREASQIISEINDMVENGYKEVVLTGVHVGRYKRDGLGLVELSRQILEQTKIERIRYSSIDPKEFSDDLVDLISKSDRICRHLHIPLQSGDDVILSRMKRDYTPEEYRELANKIDDSIPDVMIGADVIVGFPGETDEQFENTCKLVKSSPINYLHVFSYSDRKGTIASSMPDKIDPQVIHKRSEILHDLGKVKWRSYINRFLGKELNVLVENRRDRKTGNLIGLSDNYIRVLLDGDDSLRNRIVSVHIIDRHENKLLGEAIASGRGDS